LRGGDFTDARGGGWWGCLEGYPAPVGWLGGSAREIEGDTGLRAAAEERLLTLENAGRTEHYVVTDAPTGDILLGGEEARSPDESVHTIVVAHWQSWLRPISSRQRPTEMAATKPGEAS
jgi:hypothetical protein